MESHCKSENSSVCMEMKHSLKDHQVAGRERRDLPSPVLCRWELLRAGGKLSGKFQ